MGGGALVSGGESVGGGGLVSGAKFGGSSGFGGQLVALTAEGRCYHRTRSCSPRIRRYHRLHARIRSHHCLLRRRDYYRGSTRLPNIGGPGHPRHDRCIRMRAV